MMRKTLKTTIILVIATFMSVGQGCLKEQFDNIKQSTDSICVNVDFTAFEFKAIENINLGIEVLNSQLSALPFNHSICIALKYKTEAHLPNMLLTDLADLSLVGSGNDELDLVNGNYYVSRNYLPWVINIPITFDYPYEKVDIT